MSDIYFKLGIESVPEVGVGGKVIFHNGKGWVHGEVTYLGVADGRVDVRATSLPMLAPGEATRRAGRVLSSIVGSEDTEIEDYDIGHSLGTYRQERRLLNDRLGDDVARRLYGDASWGKDAYITTTFEMGGPSTISAEQEFRCTLECGNYVVDVNDLGGYHLNALIEWLDGGDPAGVYVERKAKA